MTPSEPPDPQEIDPWDLDRLRLPAEMIGNLVARKRPPRHRPGEAFLKGPISFAWVATACRLSGIGLHVALTVRFLRERFRRGRDRRWNLDSIAKGLLVSPDSVRRGLHTTERAGLLTVSRKPGCKILVADVTIVEPSAAEAEPDRQALRGPIPWTWLLPALRLPGPALQAAVACWLQAGWNRSAEFELGLSDWAELGLTRFSAARGLECLAGAGLITVVRQSGRKPVVSLQDGPRRPPGASAEGESR